MGWSDIPEYEENLAEKFSPEWHSVYTIQLGELIEKGYFTWDIVKWSGIGEYTENVKEAFEARFYFSEISMLPPLAWVKKLGYKLEYELTPKYLPIFNELQNSSYLQDESEYTKRRQISSTYPETLLDNTNEAYASSGTDYEEERIHIGDISEKMREIPQLNSAIGQFLDELEVMFIGLYTTHINGF